VDYIITNKEVGNFLKRNFVFSGKNICGSGTKIAQSEFGPLSPSRPITPSGKVSCRQVGSISPNSKRLICDTWDRVPLPYFLRALVDEFRDVIEDHQLSESHVHKLKMLLKA
jgi:hypothetical protein